MTPHRAQHTTVPANVDTRWLRVAWTALTVIALYALSIFAVGLTAPIRLTAFSSNPTVRANLAASGLTPEGYELIQWVGVVALVLTCWGVGVVLLWRRPADRMALFVAFLLVALPVTVSERDVSRVLPPLLVVPAGVLSLIVTLALVAFFGLFPNGRWVPRWTRWLVLVWVGDLLLRQFGTRLAFVPPAWRFRVDLLATLLVLAGCLLAQVYRYLRVSGPVERQQTKWVVAGVAGTLLPVLLFGVVTNVAPSRIPNGSLPYVIGQWLIEVATLLIPISIGLATLRYRLWDVDPILNRVLVYGSLTAALALVYFGSVVMLQQLLRALTGQMPLSCMIGPANSASVAGYPKFLQPSCRKRLTRGGAESNLSV